MVNRLRKLSLYLLIPLLPLLFGGCGSPLPFGPRLPLHQQMAPLPAGPVCRVAVLPFQNDTEYPLGNAIFAKVFAAQFQSLRNHLVTQEGDVFKVYQQLHILPGETPTQEELQIVASRLNTQLLITGIVLEMRENRGEYGSIEPALAVNVQIRDGGTGEALWTTYHRRQGTDYQKTMHFGTIHTITGLSRQVAVEIINLWSKKGFSQCDASPRS